MTKRIKVEGYPGVYYRMAERIGGKGQERVYYAVWKKNGKVLEEKLGRQHADNLTPARASGIRNDLIENRRKTRKQIRAEKKALENAKATVGDAWSDYLKAKRTKWSDRHYADHLALSDPGGRKVKRGEGKIKPGPLAELMDLKLSALTSEKVASWAKVEAAQRGTRTRLSFSLLRAFINWCTAHDNYKDLVSPDACNMRIRKDFIPRGNAKVDCLQREQLPAWFKAVRELSNPVISAYLQTLLLTGARREELARLRWKDVDFKWQSMTIIDKVEGERTIPLTPYVSSLLSTLPRRKQWVFSSPTAKSGRLQEPRHPHNRALALASIEGLTIHGLRRSFGTLSEWVEVPVGVVAQLMGHKPSALAEKHYRQRPLDLLRMWHVKIETWIIDQAGIAVLPHPSS